MPTQSNVNRAARKARLLGSVTFVVGLWPLVPAVAHDYYDCGDPGSGSTSCTVPSGTATDGVSIVLPDAGAGDYPYTVDNQANISASTSAQSSILHLEIDGESGEYTSDSAGISGGALKLTNEGNITLQGGGGSWGQVSGIFVQANGGAGVRPDDNGDGGRGGDSGTIQINNSGTITIDASAGSSLPTVTGIYAGASAGAGGDMNSGAGDQKGGNSGDAKTVDITNSGAIQIGSESSAFTGDGGGHGIYAYGDGKSGGSENGEGGAGATVSVTNNAAISLYWKGDGTSEGVHGIYARSKGGNGIDSGDNSDAGGKGESGRPITLMTNDDITIFSSLSNGGAPEGASAGMYAISQGGDGGAGPDKDHDGGAGGGASIDAKTEESAPTTITVQNAAKISTSGAGIMGVAARSLGGNGGDGGDGTSGGAGGYGGLIQINVQGGATITTDGDEGYAVLGQSVGGIGGGNASTAGAGGNGGNVGFYASSGTTITTRGDHAAGVTLHSIGGGGGVGGDFTNVLAGDGGDGGNGGDGGPVEITSGADVTTHGRYAHGLLVQSIGGSGGAGGVGAGLVLALGGQGGEGGGGENVIVNNTGAVTTWRYGANGIVAQTLSGGGGAAGAAGGAISVGGNAGAGANNSATAYVTNNNDVTTKGDAAIGILVQSIGGGGGSGAGAAGIAAVGGSGGAGGYASSAKIFHVGGTVKTSGEFSHGLVAQSIGGGGGSGGNVIDVSVGAGLGIGGSGSGGGNGGFACVSNTYDGCDQTDSAGEPEDGSPSDDGDKAPALSGSTIITSGDFSIGAMAQSIGGGGGNGGTANGAGALDVATLQIGGSAGEGSDSGKTQMTFDNLRLTTHGNNALGLLTQSIGGGGGNGGSANSADVEDILPVQVGGTGGGGGSGVEATTELSGGRLVTTGAHSSAVVTQSIGGGGGNGGSAAGFNTSVGLGINTSVGASGGSGGNGGTVSVNVASTTISTGIDASGKLIDGVTDSHAIVAQSIGGGGGNGGTSVADAMTVAFPGAEADLPPIAASITTSVGGKGGVAGVGGTVAATLSGTTFVQTGGDGSIGVLAQSIAQGGGNGGSASSLSGTIGDLDTFSSGISTAVGGAGGAGGNTGDASVELNDTASVHTAGDHSNAVVVQSIGGGGGNGGVGSASNDQIGGGFNLSADIGLGGAGGSGGTPGSATVHLEDGTSISTSGSGSRGVLAQSIGGGGGTGQGGTIGLSGSASVGGGEGEEAAEGEDEEPISGSVTVNIGSETGNGMTGGTVSVTANGSITTYGGDADGILAQSIGGSGGLAGSVGNDAGSDEDGFGGGDEDTKYSLTASLGGAGGTGGTGGEVDIIIEKGHVTTTGDWADGVVAQSIGGGGGAGGTSTAAGSDATASIDLAIGGFGGAGGDGGAVNATFAEADASYVVSTSGFAAYGVLLQSIGGGGGQGGDGSDSATGGIAVGGGFGGSGGSSGDGKAVTIISPSALSVLTQGHDAHAVVAQSIGGGGGIGGAGSSEAATDDDSHSIDLSVGGSGGSSGSGGTVELAFTAPWSGIQTKGDRSYGVLAQSIGGGGGLGGGGSSDSVTSLTVGGSGGAAGDGEAVKVSMAGTIHTTGIDAHGIVAQSIGGGGGIGGAGTVTADAPLKFGGQGGGRGDGGDVTLQLSGLAVTTEGNGAHAVIAQSIGGGGGIAGGTGGSVDASNYDYITNYLTGSDSSGSGHAVSVNVDNNITTHGDRAHGIVAQSIADGGGIYGYPAAGATVYGSTSSNFYGTTASGDVTFSQAGTLTTNGAGSIGIFAQSTSLNGAMSSDFTGTITGTVSGKVTGGTGYRAAAIYVIDGKNNTLTVSKTGSVAAGDSDAWSIYYFGHWGNDYSKLDVTIDEGGTVSDNISLSVGTVYNNSQSSLISASLYEADIVNNGRLVVGDSESGDKTRITRDLTQTDAGFVQVGVDFDAGRSGRLIVEGDADLAGGVHLDTKTLVRNVELGVLNVEGNLTGSIDAMDSPAVDFSARTLNKEIRVKAIDSRFANAFDRLSDNQREAGRHLDAIFDRDSGRYARLLGGINMLSWEEDGGTSYAAALSSLSPGGSQAAAAAQATLAAGRLDGALRCSTFSGEATRSNEDSCLWADAGGAAIEQDGLPGYDGTIWGFGTGGQVEFGDNWFAGGAIGYEDSQFDGTDGLTSADGGTGYLAVALGRSFGDLTLSAAVAGSYGSFDTTRSLFLPDFSGTAEGNTDVTTMSARLRAAYTMGTERAYLRPSVDLDVIYTHASGYTESGAGIYNLDVSSQEQTAFVATPAVEIGGSRPLGNDWHMGGFASAGVSFSSEDAWETDATLSSAPNGAGTFSTTLPIADIVAKLSAGVSFVNESNDLEVKLEYDGAFGDDYSSHGGLLRLSKRF